MKEALIDTSLQSLTLVIRKDGKVTYVFNDKEKKRTAEEIIPEMKKGAEASGFEFKDFDALYVTDGPGSYTGERIALAVAKVYSFLKKEAKIYICSSLKVMSSVKPDSLVMALSDARNMAYFAGAYQNGREVFSEKRAEQKEIEEFLKKNPECLVAVTDDFKKTAEDRFPHNKVIGVNLAEALVSALPYFKEAEDTYALKARYLRGKEDAF